MLASRRGFLSGLAGAIFAPAIVRADSLMKVHTIPERYATVWGVGHDLEVVEHVVWTTKDILEFATDRGGINKFREVTEVVYTAPQPAWPIIRSNHWAYGKPAYQDWFANERKAILNEATGFTNVAGLQSLKDWNSAQSVC